MVVASVADLTVSGNLGLARVTASGESAAQSSRAVSLRRVSRASRKCWKCLRRQCVPVSPAEGEPVALLRLKVSLTERGRAIVASDGGGDGLAAPGRLTCAMFTVRHLSSAAPSMVPTAQRRKSFL